MDCFVSVSLVSKNTYACVCERENVLACIMHEQFIVCA